MTKEAATLSGLFRCDTNSLLPLSDMRNIGIAPKNYASCTLDPRK